MPILNLGAHDCFLKRLQDVCLEISSVFNSAAEADEIIKDTSGLPLVFGDTSMSHATGDLAKTLNSTQTLCEDEDAGILAESLGSFLAALDPEAQHTATHTVSVLFDGDLSVWVGLDAGVVDLGDVGRSLESESYSCSVGRCLSCTEMKGLQATVGEPAVKGRWDGPDGVLKEG
jgi:hypothetical protein